MLSPALVRIGMQGSIVPKVLYLGGGECVCSSQSKLKKFNVADLVDSRAALFRTIRLVCFVCGFLLFAASIIAWIFFKTGDFAHGERFGIFAELWAPTFFILSDRFRH